MEVLESEVRDDLFIKGYRSFANPKSKLHINAELFYLYSLLSLNERRNGLIRLNISHIEKELPILYKKSEKDNRNEIANQLTILKELEIITFEHTLEEILKNEIFNICINHYLLEDKKFDEYYSGFQKIHPIAFYKIKRIPDLFIHFIVRRFDDYEEGFKCSYTYWQDLLQCSLSTAKRQVKNALDNKVIYANVGNYETGSRNKQQVNRYRTYEFTQEEKTNRTIYKEKGKVREQLPNVIQFGDNIDDIPF